jgi:type III restriction enzyme
LDPKGERRPAGYVIASQSSKAFDDPGVFFEIPLVNKIRPRVQVVASGGISRRNRHHEAPA